MNEKSKWTVGDRIIWGVMLLITLCGTGLCIFSQFQYSKLRVEHTKLQAQYAELQATVDAANAGELQRKYDSAIDELGRVQSDLADVREYVGGLEAIKSEWATGIERLEQGFERSYDGISRARTGNEQAEAAFRAIYDLSYIFEEEFGGRGK